MRIPTLYLKWHAFRELIDSVDTDKDVGIHLFRQDDGAERFSKLLKGDLSCPSDIAQSLTAYMNARINAVRARSKGGVKADATPPAVLPSDLELPTFTFVAKLIEQLPTVDDARLERAHKALLRDLTLSLPREGDTQLAIEKFETGRSFPPGRPSGGAGPIIFEAGKHKGQLAIIGETRVPIAAYTMFTRDPSPIGKRMWDLAWGEAIVWFPAPSVPVSSDGRLLLMAQPEPVNPQAGRFTVTTALVWTQDAQQAIDPRSSGSRSHFPDEVETGLFLTRLRRIVEDKRKKWEGALTVLSAEYLVKA